MPEKPKAPFRKVTTSSYYSIGAGVFHSGMGRRIWQLELECGHAVDRPVSYTGGKKGWGVLWNLPAESQIKPALIRTRCEKCLE